MTTLPSILLLALLQPGGGQPAGESLPAARGDAHVLELLEAFQARLYDPLAEGLESLAFDVVLPELETTGGRPAGVIHVSWDLERGTLAQVELASFDPEAPVSQPFRAWTGQLMNAMLQQQLERSRAAERVVELQTNGMLREIRATTVPRVQGRQGGLVRVVCPPRPGTSSPIVNRVLRFDRTGLPAEAVVVVEETGPSGPPRRVRTECVLAWEPLPEAEGRLVLAGKHPYRPDDTSQGTTTYQHEDVAGFQLVTKVTHEGTGWSPPLPEVVELRMEGFVVNGVPVEGR